MPVMYTGVRFMPFARSAVVTRNAAAPSDTSEQSIAWNGVAIQRSFMTSSTVTTSRSIAFHFRWACSDWVATTAARASCGTLCSYM